MRLLSLLRQIEKPFFSIGVPMRIVVNRQAFIEVKLSGMKGVEPVRRELRKQFAEK